jgi:ABC-type antimicrobial peptide transport system permease subunit
LIPSEIELASRFSVSQGTVRKAIGAQQRDILRSILGEGGLLILLGVTLGGLVAVLGGRALEAQLYDVRSADPLSLAGAITAFTVVAMVTCVLPALRAARTDLSALHRE